MQDERTRARAAVPLARVAVPTKPPGAQPLPHRVRAPLDFVPSAATKKKGSGPPVSAPRPDRLIARPAAVTRGRTDGPVAPVALPPPPPRACPGALPGRTEGGSGHGPSAPGRVPKPVATAIPPPATATITGATLASPRPRIGAKNAAAGIAGVAWPICWGAKEMNGIPVSPTAVADAAPVPSARVRIPRHPVAWTALLASHYTIRKHGIPDEQLGKHRRWLTVQPVDRSAYGGRAATAPVVLYAEGAYTFTVPRYYGLALWAWLLYKTTLRSNDSSY